MKQKLATIIIVTCFALIKAQPYNVTLSIKDTGAELELPTEIYQQFKQVV